MSTARNDKEPSTSKKPVSSLRNMGGQTYFGYPLRNAQSPNEAEFGKVLTKVIGLNIEQTQKRRPRSHRRQDDNLLHLRRRLRAIKKKRYPSSLYDLTYKTVMTANGKRMRVMYVQYKQPHQQPIDRKLLDEIKDAAIKERKINLIAGVIYAMKLSPNYFTLKAEQKIQIENKLMELIDREENKSKNKSPTEIMDEFVNEMTGIIASETKLKNDEIIRKIRNAERYFVAKNNANKILVYQHNFNDTHYYQVDVPLNHQFEYTDKQKQEFLAIRDSNNKPTWFTNLPNWEQECLLELIPNDIKGDWNQFAQFSSMQHIPGLKNARVNHLVSSNRGNINVISNSIKTGTIVPYEMGMNSPDTNATADDTAEQLLSALHVKAKENFNKKWGSVIFINEKPKPVGLVLSILSNVKAVGGADIELTNLQGLVVKNNVSKFNDIKIISGNEPVNFLRGLARQKDRWEYAKEVITYAKNFINSLPNNLNKEQDKSKKLINFALEELEKLKKGKSKRYFMGRRNYEAFKVAYLAILVEEMGGAVSTNCKSGKDRTGLDELYRHTMRIYFDKYKKLPGYFDDGQDRQNFIEIYAQLFNTMKIQEAASMNTPGSFGIKDDAMMLCPDIADYLGNSYKYSNQISAINKPKKTFMKDEAKQTKEIKEKNNKIALQKELKADLGQVHKNNIERKSNENVNVSSLIFEKLKALTETLKLEPAKYNLNSFFKLGRPKEKVVKLVQPKEEVVTQKLPSSTL